MKVGNCNQVTEMLKIDKLTIIGKQSCHRCSELTERLSGDQVPYVYIDFDIADQQYPGFFRALVDVKHANNVKNLSLPLIIKDSVLYTGSMEE